MMRTQKRKHRFSKFTPGAIALVMSLALLLGSAQTTLAKSTPTPDPSLQSGVTDGGGGGVDVEAIVVEGISEDNGVLTTTGSKQNNSPSHVYAGGKLDSGPRSSGLTILELSSFGYYRFVFDVLIVDLMGIGNSSPVEAMEVSSHE